MLKNRSQRTAQLFLLGAALGTVVFLLVYGLAPLDVANDAFCRGGFIEKDIQQHYAGWLFYRHSALSWPLGVTQDVNYPAGGGAGRHIPVFRVFYPCLLCTAGRVCGAALRFVCRGAGRAGDRVARLFRQPHFD